MPMLPSTVDDGSNHMEKVITRTNHSAATLDRTETLFDESIRTHIYTAHTIDVDS